MTKFAGKYKVDVLKADGTLDKTEGPFEKDKKYGIYIIKRSLLDLIPDNIFYDATDFINLLTSIGKSVIRYPLVGYWVDIGKHEDYKKVQDLVKHLDLT